MGWIAKVYQLMAAGLAVTGIAALAAASPAAVDLLVLHRGVVFLLVLAQLVAVFSFAAFAHRVSAGAAAAMFFGYAALTGLTFSAIFLVYASASIAGTFFVAAGAFAALSAYGTLTKRDLDSFGSFLFMGLVGLIVASIINVFVSSSAIYWVTSFVGVILFTGLAAYNTAQLKQLAATGDVDGEAGRQLALRGALMLYLGVARRRN